MEQRSITLTNVDIVPVLSSYSWQTGQAIYITSGTGYISDALLVSLTSPEQRRRYQGFRRIDRIIGHFEPTNPNGRNENGGIHINLASVENVVQTAKAARLVAAGSVHLEILLVRRPPPQPPKVIGRKRIQANRS